MTGSYSPKQALLVERVLSILRCLTCREHLDAQENELVYAGFGRKYPCGKTYEDVFRWFESSGLQDLRVIEQPIAIQGRKPAVGETWETRAEREVSQCAG